MRISRQIVTILFFILFQNMSFSQNSEIIDSLIVQLQITNGDTKGEILYKLGSEYEYRGKFSKAIECYKNAANILSDNEIKSSVFYSLGAVNKELENYDKATEYTLEGFRISEIRKDSARIIEGYNNLATIYSDNNQFAEAIIYYKKALAFNTRKNRKDNQAAILINLSTQNINLKKYNIAFEQANKAYLLSKELKEKNPIFVLAALNNMASIYNDKKEYENAIETFKKAYLISTENQLNYYTGVVMSNLASTFLTVENYTEAENYANKSLLIFEELQISVMIMESYKLLSGIQKEKGNFEKSLSFFSKYVSFSDSISKTHNNNKYNELLIMHSVEQKENEIFRLIVEKEKDKAKLKQKNILISLISVILLISLISLTIFIVLQQKLISSKNNIVKQNRELVKSEFQLKESKIELNKIIKQLEQYKPDSKFTAVEKEKYKNIIISENKIDKLASRIVDLMENEKIYLKTDTSQKKVADILETNTSYISLVINQKFDCNFNTFLNKYRIKEACSLLSKTDMKLTTIEAISLQVGFNSTSTFNKSFKNEIGITPSYYLKSIVENNF